MKFFDSLCNFLLPRHCLLCASHASGQVICQDCERDLPVLGTVCPRCALPGPTESICGACLRAPPYFDRTQALWPYSAPVDRLIQSFKFHARLDLAPWFALKLQNLADETGFQSILLPMPLHRSRLAERGFNQCVEVARHLAPHSHFTQPAEIVTKTERNPPQANLPLRDRAANTRGVFKCRRDLTGLRIIVLDDVMTTGATLNELARTLKAAGATQVTNWILARTLFHVH